jgi:hypothetical protein
MPLSSQVASMSIIPDDHTTNINTNINNHDKIGILVVGIGGYNGTTVSDTLAQRDLCTVGGYMGVYLRKYGYIYAYSPLFTHIYAYIHK